MAMDVGSSIFKFIFIKKSHDSLVTIKRVEIRGLEESNGGGLACKSCPDVKPIF
jgi:hypothetical protein